MSLLAESQFERCTVAAGVDCGLEGMHGKPTLVFPGKGTTCLSGEDYAFAVYPGATDKLAFYFQGGGACWVANGAFGRMPVMQCTNDMEVALQTSGGEWGILNRHNDLNPFKDWTIVEPLYCSGDAFVGHADVDFGGEVLKQRGYINALSAKEWALHNFKGQLENFAVMGFSAGSLGTHSWAEALLDAFSYKRASVLLDSYGGIFPGSTQQATIKEWGACETPLWPAMVKAKCRAGGVTVQFLLESAMRKHHDVAFGSIQSKQDGSQIWFYKGMAQSWGMVPEMSITPAQFYSKTNDMYIHYRMAAPNFAVYYVAGGQHCFLTSSNLFYTASTAGKEAAAPDGTPMLHQWVERLVSHQSVRTECAGSHAKNGVDTMSYCALNLASLPLQLAAHRGA